MKDNSKQLLRNIKLHILTEGGIEVDSHYIDKYYEILEYVKSLVEISNNNKHVRYGIKMDRSGGCATYYKLTGNLKCTPPTTLKWASDDYVEFHSLLKCIFKDYHI